MTSTHPAPLATLGGQAVVEGVMVRSPRNAAIVVRRPNGTLASRVERGSGLLAGPLRRIPFLRGVLVLLETLVLGVRALAWSSAVASNEVDKDGRPPELGLAGNLALAAGFAFTVAVFFVGPAVATIWLDRFLPSALVVLIEGAVRLGLLVAYMWNLSRSPQVRRVFQYHGAEHMAIQAYEHNLPLTTPSVRRFDKEHPRCGTSFLLTVVIVSVLVFLPLSGPGVWWRLASRVLLVPVVAGVSYEAIRLGSAYSGVPVVRWLFSANIALQHLTTREPDDEQVQVAIAAVERCIEAERTSLSR